MLRRLPLLLAVAAPVVSLSTWAGSARAQQADAAASDAGAPQAAPAQPTAPATPSPSSTTKGSARDSLLPSGASGGAGAVVGPSPASPSISISPSQDAHALASQGDQRPSSDGSIGTKPADVYSDDWWSHTRPILEVHGYFRTRAELFHNFSLGRHDAPGTALWPQPLDNSYTDVPGNNIHSVALCEPDATGHYTQCQDKTQSGANIRFRVAPEIHISDNLRVMSQIDMLDNLVLGSTPDSYAVQPSATGATGFRPAGTNPIAPLGINTTTQGPPTAGVNGYTNSIAVKRAWAEYMTPVGQVRFGRMPDHWGLGMVHNAGDTIDSDYQSTTDRLMFVSGIKSMDLYFGGSWDFISTGATSANPYTVYGGQPYNTSNLSNVNQWSLFIAHRMNPDLQRLSLSRGDLVVNGGLYTTYRTQYLDVASGQTPLSNDATSATAVNNGYEHRGAYLLQPDAWLQILWNKLRVEAELSTSVGHIDTYGANAQPEVREWGLATQTEFRAVDDKLHLEFGFGWASGDPWVNGLTQKNGVAQELNGVGPVSTFAFHPDYRVDLIFFRHILNGVQGAYYFRPSVDYDFLRHPDGQKFGGGAAIIWSRASEFEQTPGKKRDLGVELDLQVYYQAKDGSLNDDPKKLGGFYAMLQYGVFFPLGALSYMPGEQTASTNLSFDTSAAQTLRLLLGVAF